MNNVRPAKILIAAFAFAALALAALAQKPPASPPAEARLELHGKLITIKYSAPYVKGRQIFGPGGLLSHDKNYPVWRAGANSATALHTGAGLQLGSLHVPPGNYTLYVLVSDPNHWVLIVNKETGQWGLTYHPQQDLGRVPMRMSRPPETIEQLKYTLTPDSLTLEWDGHIASVPMQVE